VSRYDIPVERWSSLGRTAPSSLADARLQLHHAVQIIASFGQALVKTRGDDSHRNMDWSREVAAFRSWPAADGRFALVRADPFEITLEGSEMRRSLLLHGQTLEGAYGWMEDALAVRAGTLAPPEYDIPGHAVGAGAPFDPEPAALAELARWFENADLALGTVASGEAGASAVRCWPHHFDIATLIPLEGEGPDGHRFRTVATGIRRTGWERSSPPTGRSGTAPRGTRCPWRGRSCWVPSKPAKTSLRGVEHPSRARAGGAQRRRVSRAPMTSARVTSAPLSAAMT
jgi:hypothetical protein